MNQLEAKTLLQDGQYLSDQIVIVVKGRKLDRKKRLCKVVRLYTYGERENIEEKKFRASADLVVIDTNEFFKWPIEKLIDQNPREFVEQQTNDRTIVLGFLTVNAAGEENTMTVKEISDNIWDESKQVDIGLVKYTELLLEQLYADSQVIKATHKTRPYIKQFRTRGDGDLLGQ